jgi:RNA polymerase sigma-70 factor (ECF subfamily)
MGRPSRWVDPAPSGLICLALSTAELNLAPAAHVEWGNNGQTATGTLGVPAPVGVDMGEDGDDSTPGARSLNATEPTGFLLEQARGGDAGALERLFGRYLPRLRSWARGRLPRFARGGADTTDLVQDVAFATFRRLNGITPHPSGTLGPYLREALANRVRDEIRKAVRKPAADELPEQLPDVRDLSPFEETLRGERRGAYLAALKRLRPRDQNAIVARMELGYSWEQIALAFDWPTREAAMVATRRALGRLTAELRHAQ